MNGNGKQSVNFDSRIFSIEPWNGIPSEWFVRIFLPELHGWLHGQGDEYYSLYEHVVTQTAYGCVNEPMPRPAMTSAVQAKHEKLEKQRCRKSFAFLRLHVLDVSLKKEFDQYGKNANGVHCGASVYVILLQRGTPPQSMMLTTSQDTEWHEATLALVGIDEDTLHRFLGYLIQLNEERPR